MLGLLSSRKIDPALPTTKPNHVLASKHTQRSGPLDIHAGLFSLPGGATVLLEDTTTLGDLNTSWAQDHTEKNRQEEKDHRNR